MIEKQYFPSLINFLNTFFCQTFYFNELIDQVKFYNKISSTNTRKQLKKEVLEIKNYDWRDIKEFFSRNTERQLKNKENIYYILNTILENIGFDKKIYEGNGYIIIYKIKDEWENTLSVEVEIKNINIESIINWAIKYDIIGEITQIWNADIYINNQKQYIVKNNGYNYEIKPNESVIFNYILKGEKFELPEKFDVISFDTFCDDFGDEG